MAVARWPRRGEGRRPGTGERGAAESWSLFVLELGGASAILLRARLDERIGKKKHQNLCNILFGFGKNYLNFN
jgi:hypothetical protein